MNKYIPIFILLSFCLAKENHARTLSGSAGSPKIALTFDACMTGGMIKKLDSGLEKSLYNAAVIEYLSKEKIPATIFITGLWAEKYPEVVRQIGANPLFEIGNHSYSHRGFVDDCYSLPSLPEGEKRSDFDLSQEILTRLTGTKPKLFRFPGGCANPQDVNMAKNQGLKVVGWTFASGDAFNKDIVAIASNVLQKARANAVVVFHLSGGRYAPVTAEVIQSIVPELRKRGFVFVKVSDLNQP
jgi:peptidoglycan/xylan/chitin deacetylase (PgdA/CDA1 family)